MMAKHSSPTFTVVTTSVLLAAASLAATGCDDRTSATKPRADAVPARSAATAARTAARPSTATASTTAGAAATAGAQSSASAAAAAPLTPRPARKLRDGERATAERAFSEYARLDFAQSFVVNLEGLGTCSFVTQTTEQSNRAKIEAQGGGAAPTAAPSAAPTATAASTAAAAAGDDRAVPSFHLVCKDQQAIDLPDFGHVESAWTFQQVDAVGFSDIDADGDTDIIAIASYLTGVGPEGAKPFSVVILFRNDGKSTFSLQTDQSNALTKAGVSTVAAVLAELGKKEP